MPGHAADRNMLFGILALQMDLITRDALIAAMGAWALAKHRPIGEILVEAGALDPVDRADLEPMIDRRIAREGGDPARSLAGLSSVASIAAEIRRSIADPDVLDSLSYATRNEPPDPYATRVPDPDDTPPSSVRYRKVRDHAKGGLGIVFVARDEELNREVALKEIQERHADNPSSRARFLIEAEITGGLEHPGIVPVYGLGHYDDGRPFYAMRFIRGDSLKEAIAAFHADESLKSDPGARTLALQKLLRRFLDVCNAIEYAHSRGVLHRDLKPDNVMVGRYGETLVVDWGLAKSVERPEGHWPESRLTPSSSSGSAETIPGSVIGTPAYMSPEQAEARFDLLGPASDVYSLGATLYSLLTGHPPITGKPRDEVLADVRQGIFPRPRDHARWLDPALEAICLKAMALRPDGRYPSTKALAEDVERWLADEPVTAHREPWSRRALRWTQRHRTAVTTAMTTSIVVALVIGGFAAMDRARRSRTEAAVIESLDLARRRSFEAESSSDRARWAEATAAAETARHLLDSIGGGDRQLRLRVQTTLDDLLARQRDRKLIDDLDEARLLGDDVNAQINRFDLQPASEACSRALKEYGIDLASMTPAEVSSRVRASRIGDRLTGVLLELASYPPKGVPAARMLEMARASSSDPRYEEIRLAYLKKDPATLAKLFERAEVRAALKGQTYFIATLLANARDATASLPVLERLREENPGDFWANQILGSAYSNAKPPRHPDALRFHTAATSLRPGSPGALYSLAHALESLGDNEAASRVYRRALELRPEYVAASARLAIVLSNLGRRREAEAVAREAVRRAPENGTAHTQLGLLLLGHSLTDKRPLDEAEKECREGVRLQPGVSWLHSSLAQVLKMKGDFSGAETAAREAIRIDPRNAEGHWQLGDALQGRGDSEGALAAYRESARLSPGDPIPVFGIAYTLRDKGDADGSLAAFREASRLKPDDSVPHLEIGLILMNHKKDYDGSIAESREAIRLKPDDAMAYNNISACYVLKKDYKNAIPACREAIRLQPDLATAYANLAAALTATGDPSGGAEALRQSIRLRFAPKRPPSQPAPAAK